MLLIFYGLQIGWLKLTISQGQYNNLFSVNKLNVIAINYISVTETKTTMLCVFIVTLFSSGESSTIERRQVCCCRSLGM